MKIGFKKEYIEKHNWVKCITLRLMEKAGHPEVQFKESGDCMMLDFNFKLGAEDGVLTREQIILFVDMHYLGYLPDKIGLADVTSILFECFEDDLMLREVI